MNNTILPAPEQALQTDFTVCKVCGVVFKKLTASHLKKHGLTFDDYTSKYEPERSSQQLVEAFINDFYISVRYRFLEYSNGRVYTVNCPADRSYKLCGRDIDDHLAGKKGIGVYFPRTESALIGIDIDSLDLNILRRVYNALGSYGIDDNNMLMSYSGSKGYHVDLFLSDMVDKEVIKKFCDILLNDIGEKTETVQFYGGSGTGYKLPFGYHYKTGQHCHICDESGIKLPLEHLQSITRLDVEQLHEIVDINFIPNEHAREDIRNEDILSGYNSLPCYEVTNENNKIRVEALILAGVHCKGSRHNSIFHVALYCKDVKRLAPCEAIEFLQKWVDSTWSPAIVDREVLTGIVSTAKSVYKSNLRFNVSANERYITRPELNEVFTVLTDDARQSEPIVRLYFALVNHSKAYADPDGVFYMSFSQMSEAVSVADRSTLGRRLKELEKAGKLLTMERNRSAGSGSRNFKQPNKYKLPSFQNMMRDDSGKIFKLCGKSKKCKDCALVAANYLATTTRERRKFVPDNRRESLPRCEANP